MLDFVHACNLSSSRAEIRGSSLGLKTSWDSEDSHIIPLLHAVVIQRYFVRGYRDGVWNYTV